MDKRRVTGLLSGLAAGAAGIAVAELLSGLLRERLSPLQAVAESVVSLAPGRLDARAISAVGHADKPLLVLGTLLGFAVVAALAGLVAASRLAWGEALILLLGLVGGLAVNQRVPTGELRFAPIIVGTVVATAVLALLARKVWAFGKTGSPPRPTVAPEMTRRAFVHSVVVVGVGAVVAGAAGRWLGQSTRAVASARSSLRLRLRRAVPPPGTSAGVPGVAPWVTPSPDFYRVDTALTVPQVLPDGWRLRIHGKVRRELELDFGALLGRGLEQHWMTLCCVSNEVGGSLIGNALWAGVPVRRLLAEAGVLPGADAVLSTAVDGWTAVTPLATLTDGRAALLAVGMNGEPLPPAHGFPVRLLVPGLYGYVSATKWVEDLEVTRFDEARGFWTERGWSARGPIKTESRIDVPRAGQSVSAGRSVVAGVAWAQHRGIKEVQVRVDDRPWASARLAADPSVDCWRQWAFGWDATPGTHQLAVRAVDLSGRVQTPAVADVVPNGASGYDRVTVRVA
ncbi:MAG: molybdopterin-dependent oxidoreductase [Sciscionella sp.]